MSAPHFTGHLSRTHEKKRAWSGQIQTRDQTMTRLVGTQDGARIILTAPEVVGFLRGELRREGAVFVGEIIDHWGWSVTLAATWERGQFTLTGTPTPMPEYLRVPMLDDMEDEERAA